MIALNIFQASVTTVYNSKRIIFIETGQSL